MAKTKSQITDRLETLYIALFQASVGDQVPDSPGCIFTVGERIAINQERGALYTQLAVKNGELPPTEAREYQVSTGINNKVLKAVESFNNNQIQL